MTEGSARSPRRAVDGVVLLDKPAGMTSQTAVTRVKRLFNASKAGHTGTLDPLATGLLPVALGEATKFAAALLGATKGYRATIRLGTTTTTGDLEGEVTATHAVTADRAAIEAALAQFRGDILQVPPMWSALKHEGKPLYRYAREGKDVERTPRPVTITVLTLLATRGVDLDVAVECSKGTYVRVLAEDIGRVLGCGGALAALRRTRVGAFGIEDGIGLEALAALDERDRSGCLRPVDALLGGLPALALDASEADQILAGRAIDCARAPAGTLVRLYGSDQAFLGVAETGRTGRVQPRRLVAKKTANA